MRYESETEGRARKTGGEGGQRSGVMYRRVLTPHCTRTSNPRVRLTSSGKAITEVHPKTDAGCDALFGEGLRALKASGEAEHPTETARANTLDDEHSAMDDEHSAMDDEHSAMDDVEIRPAGCEVDSPQHSMCTQEGRAQCFFSWQCGSVAYPENKGEGFIALRI
jgi:hypothetical protein